MRTSESAQANPTRWLPVVLPLALAAVAVGVFAAGLRAGPSQPAPGSWHTVPVMDGPLAPAQQVEALEPGMLLGGHDQLAALAEPLPADLSLRYEVDLGTSGNLHAFVRARGLQGRDSASGLSLFLDRTGGVGSGFYRVRGADLAPLECDPAPEIQVPRRVGVEIRTRRDTVEAYLDGQLAQSCRAPGVRGAEVGFRTGLAPVSVSAVQVRDPGGSIVFEDRPERRSGWAARWLAVAMGLAALAALWVVDGLLTGLALASERWLPPRRSAWSYLALVALPLLAASDLQGLAAGLRLGHTPVLALVLALALTPLVLARLASILAASPALRAGPEGPTPSLGAMLRTRAGAWLAGVAGGHAVVLGLVVSRGHAGLGGLLDVALPGALDAALTAATIALVPLAALALGRWLVPRGGVALCRVGAIALAPSLLAGLLGAVLVLADPGRTWNASLHLVGGLGVATVVGFLFLQVNARAVRWYNGASLAMVAAVLVLAECSARQTYLDQGWDPVPVQRFRDHPVLGWVRASQEFDFILDVAEPSDYPSERFPVAIAPPSDPDTTRIVCLGSSSTGGAYQMDDLSQFYPARLGEALEERGPGRFEVLNQGVGGWNSFLVLLYLRHFSEALHADVFTVYLGGNDMNSVGPWTYRQYWETYQQHGGRAPGLRRFLNRSRLYVGFKSLMLLRTDAGTVPTVPVEEARANYEEIIDIARERGARVVLMSEAQRPSPEYMASYNQMMREVASEHGELYLDVADALHRRSHEDLFLDQSHLTAMGHGVVSDLLLEFLVEQRLVEPAQAP